MNIIFDIDGTLTLVGDRTKELQKTPPDWDAFYERCGEDEPNEKIMDVMRRFLFPKSDNNVYFLTGRRESVRGKTLDWFARQGYIIPSGHLLMRRDGDWRHDTEVKPEKLDQLGIVPHIIFEDRNSMVKKWRELGYTCLQVADGDF